PSLQLLTGSQDSGVLGDLGDDVWPTGDRIGATEDSAADGQGVSLGAAGGEDDLGGSSADERGDLRAGPGEQQAGARGVGVGTGGVAEVGRERGVHRCEDAWVDRGGGVVVQIYGL